MRSARETTSAAVKPDPALYLLALEKLAVDCRRGDRVRRFAAGYSCRETRGPLLHRRSEFADQAPVPRSRRSSPALARGVRSRRCLTSSPSAAPDFCRRRGTLRSRNTSSIRPEKIARTCCMIATARGDDAEYVAKFHAAFGELGARTQRTCRFSSGLRTFARLLLSQDVDFRRWRQHEEHAGGLAGVGTSAGSQGSLRIRDRPRRPERGRDLLVRAGRHRFMGRRADGRSSVWDCCPAAAARITTARPSADRRITRCCERTASSRGMPSRMA